MRIIHKLRFITILIGIIVFITGFYYSFALAGIPYQDPTPELSKKYMFNMNTGNVLMEIGSIILVIGVVIFIIIKKINNKICYKSGNEFKQTKEKCLNILYAAALEFGSNWRRPLMELAHERLPYLNQSDYDEICSNVEKARSSIEDFIAEHFEYEKGLIISQSEANTWIKNNYPWMSDKNISHGISQGIYYAWHG